MSQKIKQPTLLSKVHPKVLYNTQELNARVVKVQSPFEYMNYIKRRQEYLNKQRELLNNLQLSKENYEKLTFSVKQIGVVNDDGRFGTYSQRRYLLKSMESTRQQKSESIQYPQTERAQYQFRAKALPSSRKEKFRFSPQSTAKFFLLPERQETNFEVKNSPVDKILKRSRQKKRIPQSQPLPPEVIFAKSYSLSLYCIYNQIQNIPHIVDSSRNLQPQWNLINCLDLFKVITNSHSEDIFSMNSFTILVYKLNDAFIQYLVLIFPIRFQHNANMIILHIICFIQIQNERIFSQQYYFN